MKAKPDGISAVRPKVHAGMSRIMEDKKMAKYRKLGRTASQRKALLRNQVTMLLQHGKIRTTEAKA